MEHMTQLLERFKLRREDDDLEMGDDEFDFDLDKSDDVEPDMDHDDVDPDMDDDELGLGGDDEEVDSTEARLDDLEDKVTDILNKLTQVLAQDMADDEMGDDDMDADMDADMDDDEMDMDADMGDDMGDEEDPEADDPTDDGLRGDDEKVKEYEDDLSHAGDPDDSDNEVDGDFDIDTYGARGANKARRFKDRWSKHRIAEKGKRRRILYDNATGKNGKIVSKLKDAKLGMVLDKNYELESVPLGNAVVVWEDGTIIISTEFEHTEHLMQDYQFHPSLEKWLAKNKLEAEPHDAGTIAVYP